WVETPDPLEYHKANEGHKAGSVSRLYSPVLSHWPPLGANAALLAPYSAAPAALPPTGGFSGRNPDSPKASQLKSAPPLSASTRLSAPPSEYWANEYRKHPARSHWDNETGRRHPAAPYPSGRFQW